MQRMTRRSAVLASALALWMTAAPMAAQAESPAKEFGLGAATVFANLLYGPTKLVYATVGGFVASMAYAFSGGDVEVARPIVDASLRGDYFVTLAHLRGEDSIEFVGRRPRHRSMAGTSDWGDPNPGADEYDDTDPGF